MSVAKMEAKPPYVTFELRPEEDREESQKAGHIVYKDVAFALITPAGSKDRVERVADEWLVKLAGDVNNDRFPAEWLRYYKDAFKAWQEGTAMPETGTPIRNWPVATPAQVKALTDIKVMTIEALATANEEVIGRLGMGGRALKQRAVDYLSSAKSIGVPTEELTAMRTANEGLALRNAALEKQLKELSARVASLEPAAKAT